ncbi:MAG TPA: hypothetical protein PLW95_03835 [bacterium]|nr:hypothetical protein [bacterium]
MGSLVVKSRPLGHYVLSVFSLLFREKYPHDGQICISAPGRAISRTADLVNLLCDNFAPHLLRKEKVNIDKIPSAQDNFKISTIEISLARKSGPEESISQGGIQEDNIFENFLDKVELLKEKQQEFNVCELEFIFSTLIKEGYSFYLSCPDNFQIHLKEGKKQPVDGKDINLGEVKIDQEGNLVYTPVSDALSGKTTAENCPLISSSIESSLMRIGILKSKDYITLANNMCRFDDVIIALDTNMFYKAQVTTSLLDALNDFVRSDFLSTPNWITTVVSAITIGELEHKATRTSFQADEDTTSFRERRWACRGLQEFMEIRSCVDLEGVSMILTGEISPGLDFSKEETTRDEIIRKMIKNFLNFIGFYKSSYFLTLDKICEMFAKAEGLNAFYIMRESINPNSSYKLSSLDESSDINNISELIYELGVEFPLKIICGNNNEEIIFYVNTDWPEKSLEDWENRCFMLSVKDEKNKLFKILEENGKRIKLGKLLKGWNEVNAERHTI